MKTIFISIFHGSAAKNVLRTDIFANLKAKPEIKIVLLFPSLEKQEYYRREFSGPNIIFEILPKYQDSRLNSLFSSIKFNLINTATLDLKRKMLLEMNGQKGKYLIKFIANRIFARKFFRRIISWLDFNFTPDENYRELFAKYQPDMVLLPHLFGETEISLLRQAKKRKIFSVGLINSWDKVTARSLIRLLPDKMIVHNDIIKKEVIKHADMRAEDIEIVGIPHYDYYLNKPRRGREEFFRKFNIDLHKKIIVFCPSGRAFSNSDNEIIKIIYQIVHNKLKDFNLQLLVRFPPNDVVEIEESLSKLEIVWQKPGVRFSAKRGVDWDMSFADLEDLADTLYYAGLFICYTSSMSIDAAVFDKPVINIGFDIRPNDPLARRPTQFYGMEHYKNILRYGGIAIVKSPEELENWIKEYLNNPSLNSAGRQKIVLEQCWRLDGRAGERAADFLLKCLNLN